MKAKKSLGQNFLIDNNVINKIVDEVSACNNDLIIEIGPGRGALTSKLKKKGCIVIAYELDTDLSNILSKLEDDKLHVIYKDFLNSNINDDIKDIKYNNLYLVGNLPYYITSPILMYLLESKIPFKRIVVMVQKEVADRLSSKPGTKDYGVITAAVSYYADVKTLFEVKRDCFIPSPNVDSAVIELIPRKHPTCKPKSEDMFFKTIKASFAQRRKTLLNSISKSGYITLPKEEIERAISDCGISPSVRGETLSIDDFAKLSDKFGG